MWGGDREVAYGMEGWYDDNSSGRKKESRQSDDDTRSNRRPRKERATGNYGTHLGIYVIKKMKGKK